MRKYSTAAVITLLVIAPGCATSLDPAQSHMKRASAYKHAKTWEPTIERPSKAAIENVQRIGRDRFLSRMRMLLPYPMAIHAIGWFGDMWDLHAIAQYLESDDDDTRMIAVAAVSRLSGESFGEVNSALKWWEENRDSIPLDVKQAQSAR